MKLTSRMLLYLLFLPVCTGILEKFSTGQVLYSSIFFVIMLIVATVYVLKYKKGIRKEEKVISGDVIDIIPKAPFIVGKPTPLLLKIKNITGMFGMRVRLKCRDHVSPTSIDIQIGPGNETRESIVVIPLVPGEREITFQFLPLFDENNNLVPGPAADPIGVQSFKYEAKPPLIAGLTPSQLDVLKALVKLGTIAIVLLTVLLSYMPGLLVAGDLMFLIPAIAILQIPVLYLFFFLRNRLPLARESALEKLANEIQTSAMRK